MLETLIGVVLAGGNSIRFDDSKSKLLYKVDGEEMIRHVVDAISPVVDKVVVVVGENEFEIRKVLDDGVEYVKQEKPLGTGHALLMTEGYVDGDLLVCYGDKPWVNEETFRKVKESYKGYDAVIAVARNGEKTRKGRILRSKGEFRGIKEYRECSEEERKIEEVNAGIYVFNSKQVFPFLRRIGNKNAVGEYYLTDVFEFYVQEGLKVGTVEVGLREGMDVNRKEDLEGVGK